MDRDFSHSISAPIPEQIFSFSGTDEFESLSVDLISLKILGAEPGATDPIPPLVELPSLVSIESVCYMMRPSDVD